MESFWDRLRILIENEGISVNKFEDTIGASRGVIAKSIRNKSDLSSRWIILIKEKFPHYSLDWILVGRGQMIEETIAIDRSALDIHREDIKRIEELTQKNVLLSLENYNLKEKLKKLSLNTGESAYLLNTSKNNGLDFGDSSDIADSNVKDSPPPAQNRQNNGL